jgi:hypothetical protein
VYGDRYSNKQTKVANMNHHTRLSGLRLLVVAVILMSLRALEARATFPSGRYVISNGTVYDTKTKLTWQQAAPTGTFLASDASTYCRNLGSIMPGTWRLPTIKELSTLVDYNAGKVIPIDVLAFPGGSPGGWSSTGSNFSRWYLGSRGQALIGAFPTMQAVRCVQ